MLPGAFAALFLSGVGDRSRREPVLLATELARALIMALAAALAHQRCPPRARRPEPSFCPPCSARVV
jgi:hypothetical protein